MVERCFDQLTQPRGLATRYAKRAAHPRVKILTASIVFWLRTD